MQGCPRCAYRIPSGQCCPSESHILHAVSFGSVGAQTELITKLLWCTYCPQELTYETQYLAAISLVTAILLGNTFGWSFDRQRQIIQEMSEEVFAIELLLQELFIEISEPHLRWRVIKHIKCAATRRAGARPMSAALCVAVCLRCASGTQLAPAC